MRRPRYSFFAFTFLLMMIYALSPSGKKTTIWMIGDSTMCTYEASRAPLAGWGMPFEYFFDSTIIIENKARGGRSTRTFINEGRWKAVADSLQEGDYVLIQFGHNDEAKEEKYKDRYTSVPDYKNNLVKFIDGARYKKAIPVIITPVSRLRFTNNIAQETHTEYTTAAKEIATSYNVPLIDLDTKSRELYQQMGPEYSKLLFMQLDSLEHPNYPAGQSDNTHFNEYGARRIAELVLAEVRRLNLAITEHIIKKQNAPLR